MSDDTAWLDATAQAELVRSNKVSPAELVGEAITRIEALNPSSTRSSTSSSTGPHRGGGRAAHGPFHGVPFLLKDLGAELAARRTTRGPISRVTTRRR